MSNTKKILWVFDKDASKHPFIQIGIKTLRESGLDVTLVDGSAKPDPLEGRINPYNRIRSEARFARSKAFVNGPLKDFSVPHKQNYNRAKRELGKALERKKRPAILSPHIWRKAAEVPWRAVPHYFLVLLMKAIRRTSYTRLRTTDLWWSYICGFFGMFRQPCDIIIASRPQVLGACWTAARLKGKRIVYYPFELYGHQASEASSFILFQEHLFLRIGVDQLVTQNPKRAEVYAGRGDSNAAIVRNFKDFRAPLDEGRLRRELKIPAHKKIALYEGVLIPGRCLGKLAEAALHLDGDAVLVMMGPQQKAWLNDEAAATEEPIRQGKLILAPPVPHEVLLDYVADADAGIIIYDGALLNNRYCEPGKLSDYVFCEVPIAAGNYPSIDPLVRGEGIGESFDEHDPKSIAATLNSILRKGKAAYRDRLQAMADKVSWSSQRETFLAAVTGEAPERLAVPAVSETADRAAAKRKPVDILILIEHVDRELDIAALIKAKIELAQPGLSVRIANFYTEARDLIETVDPRVVVSPFFYGTDDLVLRDYVTAWADKRWINLAWEQILYGTQQALKRPRDSFTKNRVEHIAWSEWYRDYMIANGVSAYKVNWFGHSLYDLYSEEYRPYFLSRAKLASRYGLDPKRRWVFFPENYRWAFMSDAKLQRLSEGGADLEELRSQNVYCIEALDESARWLAAAAETGEVEVILRPRPAVNTTQMRERVSNAIVSIPPNFHIIKQESVREWLLASDVIVSSNSTSLIEAAVAGKPIYLSAPLKMPDCLYYEWCALVPEIRDRDTFLQIAREGGDMEGSIRVRQWAEQSFKVGSAPIDRVAERLVELANKPTPPVTRIVPRTGGASPLWLRPVTSIVGLETRHKLRSKHQPNYFFTYATHEKDLFGDREVTRRTQAWKRILRRQARSRSDAVFQQAAE